MRRSLVRAAVRPGKKLSLQSTAENWQYRERGGRGKRGGGRKPTGGERKGVKEGIRKGMGKLAPPR